jgi:hypothetical protein
VAARDTTRIATAQDALKRLPKQKDALEQLDLVRQAREALDLLEQSHVETARKAGYTWTDIGDLYGMSKQGAQQRFRGDR